MKETSAYKLFVAISIIVHILDDHSRVILKPEGKKIVHHRESDYFNANHVEVRNYPLDSLIILDGPDTL